MRRANARHAPALAFAAVVLALFGTRCTGGMREDEVECEQAVSKLTQCCPGFDPGRLHCEYSDACGTTWPEYTINDSHCIESESCKTLQQTGVCDRGQNAKPIMSTDDGGGLTPPQICP
jgi:hypothetical protein